MGNVNCEVCGEVLDWSEEYVFVAIGPQNDVTEHDYCSHECAREGLSDE